MPGLFGELKRRNVFRVTAIYAISAWLLLQVADIVFPVLSIPGWGMRLLLVLLIIGFLVTVFAAWAYELTPDGIKRDKDVIAEPDAAPKSGRKIDYAIIALLAVALVYFIYKSEFRPNSPAQETIVETQKSIRRESSDQSIAVLPFTNRSADEEDAAFFADGIHDDLLTRLSKISELKVISRTSVERYRNTKKPIPEIAVELGVSNILEGGVQRAGNRVRINAQLIDTATDEHLWAETYDEQLTAENIFDIQQRISHEIARALKATLTDADQQAIADMPTKELSAYDAYLLGKQKLYRFTVASNQEAESAFQQAITIDPEFALAYVGLVESKLNQIILSGSPLADYHTRNILIEREVGPIVNRVLQLDPDLGEAYAAKARADHIGGKFEEAEPSYIHALELDPNNWSAHLAYGALLMELRRPDEALPLFLKAGELDPNSAAVRSELGAAYEARGDLDSALAEYDKAIELDPEDASLYVAIGRLYAGGHGRLDKGFPYFLKAYELDSLNEFISLNIGWMYLNLADVDSAQEWVNDIESRGLRDVAEILQVSVYIYLGEYEKAGNLATKIFSQNAGAPALRAALTDNAIRTGDYVTALKNIESNYPRLFESDAPEIDSRIDRAALTLACLYTHMGEEQKAKNLIEGSLGVLKTGSRHGPGVYDLGYGYAYVENYTLQGRYDDALVELRKWKDDGGRRQWWALKTDLCFKPLWDKPEFIQVMDEIEQDMKQQRQNLREQGIG